MAAAINGLRVGSVRARLSRLDLVLVVMVFGAFVLYSALSIIRHETFRSTGFDLGLFEQVIGHYSRLQAPASAFKGLDSIYKDHVSPIMALLGPWYALWPRTASLLVAQAALISASAVPVFMYARARVDRAPALMLTGAYLLFGGVQNAVWIDIHEVAFAPLLIGCTVVLADRERWGWSFASAAMLLAVKEDLSFLVVAIGVWYLLLGRRRLGIAAIALGIGWFVVVTKVLIPSYTYWSYTELGANLPEALRTVVTAPWRVVEIAANDVEKLKTTAYVCGAFLGLSVLSPLVVLLIPLLAEKLLSTNPEYWTLQNHYALVIAPVLALAAADGLHRLAHKWPRLTWQPAAAMLVIAVALVPAFRLGELLRPSFYSTPAAYRAAHDALATIPAGASVAASNRLASHLGGRPNLTLLTQRKTSSPYVIAAVDDSTPEGDFPQSNRDAIRAIITRQRRSRQLVFDRDGIIVLGPNAP